MNYLKKFESFQTHDEIHKICKQYKITNYTINSDGSIDVNGDVNLHSESLRKLPLKFNNVSGNFWCNDNRLTTLEGGPQSVGDDFNCYVNKLTTLEGAPQSVNRFSCSDNKDLKSLNYLSEYIDSEQVEFEDTAVYEIFKLLDNLIATTNNKIIVSAGAGSISAQMRFFYESRR